MKDHVARWDVAIIGLGPVGATLANLLGGYGIKTIVLEKNSSAHQQPRAVMFDDEIMRVFQTLKLSKIMTDITEVGGGAKFVDGDGNILLDWRRPRELSPNGWFVNYRFHQPELEYTLRDNLNNHQTVEILWNAEVVALKQNNSGVRVTYSDQASRKRRCIDATYTVGCDGSRSFVRECIETRVEDLGFHEPWLVVDLIMNQPDNQMEPESIHFCERGRSSTQVYLGPNRKRWEFRLELDDDPNEVTNPAFVWSLLSRWIGQSEAELERASVYTFHSLIAETWRRGRLLIAGDAAHQTPPFMGQGMCAGIRDAANLAWKLNSIIKNKASDELLDSYETERHPHVKEFIELTIQMGELLNNTRTALVSRNTQLTLSGPQTLRQLKPALGPGLSAGCSQHRGEMFPQPKLFDGTRMDDQIGSGPALILDHGVDFGDLAAIKIMMDSRIKIIQDRSEDLKIWFNKSQVKAVLMRPDRYILGSARNGSDLKNLLIGANAVGL